MEINDTTKDIINSVADGSAFDRSMQGHVDDLRSTWAGINQSTTFGNRSPLSGLIDDLLDNTPFNSGDTTALQVFDRGGNPITLSSDIKNALVGKPKGALANISYQMESQINNFMDNVKTFSSHQQVLNSLGEGSGCSSLEKTFGSIAAFGQNVANMARDAKNIVNDVIQLKNQIQSEINNFDTNVIGILTGQINGTILSELVVGTGLFDQIDKILLDSGIAENSPEAAEIRQDISDLLGQHPEVADFQVTKDLSYQQLKLLKDEAGEIIRQIGEEDVTLNGALVKLRRVSDGLTMLGLFKASPCVQTLVGFNGTDAFVSKLGSA
jgi:hypothetical protein